MSPVKRNQRDHRGWLAPAIGGAVLAVLSFATLFYTLHMPGKSHTGPLPPLTGEEALVRDRLSGHVWTLAGSIGERNLWHFDALGAAADYIERTFAELGYRPEDEPFESRGQAVRNVVAERRGDSTPGEIVLVGAHYDWVFLNKGTQPTTGISATV